MENITQLLRQAEAGDLQASERLLPLVYHELRKLAGSLYFLALAQVAAKQTNAARDTREQALQLTDTELSQTQAIDWNRKLTLAFLDGKGRVGRLRSLVK